MAEIAEISNPYLSQIERGLHEPSVHVLRSIARALNVSAESLLEHAGLLSDDRPAPGDPHTDAVIRADPGLNEAQKQALLAVYRSYIASNSGPADDVPSS